MRLVVSIIEPLLYRTSKFCKNEIAYLKKRTEFRNLNSDSFAETLKECNILPNEIQTSLDVVNLYQSVPVNEVAAVVIDILNMD